MGVERGTIEAAIAGDPAALAAVVEEFWPTVLGTAYVLVGDLDRAADVTQEVFARVVVGLGGVRDPAALPGWLMAVTRTVARTPGRMVPRLAPAPADLVAWTIRQNYLVVNKCPC